MVFDMDGTLFDSKACVTTAFRETVLAGGGPQYSAADVVANYHLGPPKVILAHLLGRQVTPVDEGRYLALLTKHEALIRLYSGLGDVLAALAGAGIPTAVFTGAARAGAVQLLAATSLLGHFAVVVGGDEVPRAKPEPDGLLLACELLGVAPERTAYVGDSPLDLECARRAGAVAVAAAWGHLYDPAIPCDLTARTPGDLLALVGQTA